MPHESSQSEQTQETHSKVKIYKAICTQEDPSSCPSTVSVFYAQGNQATSLVFSLGYHVANACGILVRELNPTWRS